jgi:hypothetical protein
MKARCKTGFLHVACYALFEYRAGGGNSSL